LNEIFPLGRHDDPGDRSPTTLDLGSPDVIEYARPAALLSVAPYLALGALRLNELLRSLVRPPPRRTPRLLDSAASVARSERPEADVVAVEET